MNCLTCDLPLEPHDINGVDFLFCQDGCEGIWIHALKLKRLLNQEELSIKQFDKSGEGEPRKADQEKNNESSGLLFCPICHGMQLKQHKYHSKSNVYIKQCYSCNGVWLDTDSLLTLHTEIRQPRGEKKAIDKYLSESVKKGRKQKLYPESIRDIRT